MFGWLKHRVEIATINAFEQDIDRLAAELMVWLHSVRTSQTPEVRLRGRELRTELARGIPHACEAAAGLQQHFGMHLNVDGFERMPQNLAPDGDGPGAPPAH